MLRILMLCFSVMLLNTGCASGGSWRTASRDSMGIAADPKDEKEALVQVYVARAYGWRRYFAVHSWMATKEKNADHYVTYHVVGWGARYGGNSVQIKEDLPDRRWFGAEAVMIAEIKGKKAEEAIPKIVAAAKEYPYQSSYRILPGPNSNTFISYLLRKTPEIGVELPSNAIGKDWINKAQVFGVSETNTGFQFSLLGLLGFTMGLGDGIEVNILSLTFGVDFWRPAIKLPFVGRLGFKDAPVF